MSHAIRRYLLIGIPGALIALTVVFPLYWGVRTSLTDSSDTSLLPRSVDLANYRYLFENGDFGRSIVNSLFVCVGTELLTLPLALLGGYALARFDFAGKRYGSVLLLLPLLPAVAVLVPMIIYMRDLGLYNTLYAVILASTVFGLPFTIWMVRGFMLAVPKAVEEAARIDGSGPFRILVQIVVPLIAPGIVAVAIFVFITAWNTYLFAFAFTTRPELQVVPVALLGYITQWGTNYGGMDAAATIAMLPPLVLFLAVQRWFIQGLLAGAER
jgi:ABC-type glycerol-3-phosphate transport system permease component